MTCLRPARQGGSVTWRQSPPGWGGGGGLLSLNYLYCESGTRPCTTWTEQHARLFWTMAVP